MNTILFDNELEQARKRALDLYSIGIDTLIIQDMAYFEMNLPDDLQIFASTQTNNYSLERIKFLEDSGFSRIILVR